VGADMTTQTSCSSAEFNIQDSRGQNLFNVDPYSKAMLQTYLPPDLYEHLLPHFIELGALAGDKLDELAQIADRNPPALSVRNRAGQDQSVIHKHPAYIELERAAYSKYGLAAMSHRAGVLGWNAPMPPAAKYALTHL